jgi:predicted secreted hydrolase
MRRRAFLLASPLLLFGAPAVRAAGVYPEVLRGRRLEFPRDHGAHPDFRTEWWYITGHVRDRTQREFGFQVTFFRSRPAVADNNTSRFAPRQLILAHAALADPRHGRLRHDERAARAAFDLAGAAEDDTRVWVGDWTLTRSGDHYAAKIEARDFSLALRCVATEPPLLQGDAGFSRKGPQPQQASHYYSRPQLAVSGSFGAGGVLQEVRGAAWLDHEWSSEIMAPSAVGWDWLGVNLDDGGALMAFVMRDGSGAPLWGAAMLRDAQGRTTTAAPGEVRFVAQRHWRSPRTGTSYPVALELIVGEQRYRVEPLFDDQELDARASTGTVYWEGAVRLIAGSAAIGRGYLELTGYAAPLLL